MPPPREYIMPPRPPLEDMFYKTNGLIGRNCRRPYCQKGCRLDPPSAKCVPEIFIDPPTFEWPRFESTKVKRSAFPAKRRTRRSAKRR